MAHLNNIENLPLHRLGVRAAIVHDGSLLLVEYDDESGPHYNLPGGGIEPGESILDGLRREVREETCAEIDVGRFLLSYEYFPPHQNYYFGPQPGLSLLFEGFLRPDSSPRLPETPDPNQTAVKWVSLDHLDTITLYPRFTTLITKAIRDEYPRKLFSSLP